MASHATSHANPIAPTMKKAQRHPNQTVRTGATSGVSTAPILVPELKIPVASARSFLGNHSATALMLAGNTPDSPRPSEERAKMKLISERQPAVAMEARLQKT